DAAQIELGPPGDYTPQSVPIRARLNVIVFYRQQRAAAWSELMAREYDMRDPHSGAAQVRLSGPDDADGMWLVAPDSGGGVATVSGSRGPVGFELQITFQRPGATRLDLSARSETAARQIAGDWSDWLQRQLVVSG